MDCDALEFHSRMAGWNAVSMATEYKTVVSDPAALKTREQWCDVLILHLNTKYCRAAEVNGGPGLTVMGIPTGARSRHRY